MCQIIVPNPTVSRIQAIIQQDHPGHYILSDNNSVNGTFVNGQRIHTPHTLNDQDEIGLGAVTALLRFETFPQTISANPFCS